MLIVDSPSSCMMPSLMHLCVFFCFYEFNFISMQYC